MQALLVIPSLYVYLLLLLHAPFKNKLQKVAPCKPNPPALQSSSMHFSTAASSGMVPMQPPNGESSPIFRIYSASLPPFIPPSDPGRSPTLGPVSYSPTLSQSRVLAYLFPVSLDLEEHSCFLVIVLQSVCICVETNHPFGAGIPQQ